MDQVSKLIAHLSSIDKRVVCAPFIEYIRFPHFRNLKDGTRIDFRFPLTVLVGQNGCGKSSVLHAIFGTPGNNSTGTYWFSTSVDPIEETEGAGRNRYIYGYYERHHKKIVEVIKTRIMRPTNPDYWEPSRPLKGDGMEEIEEIAADKPVPPGRSRTRWNAVEKNVEYLDFRHELSAFDKCFYLEQSISDRQDFIRRRARHLKEVIENNEEKHSYYGWNRVFLNRELTTKELAAVSGILGRKYTSARVVEHTLFSNSILAGTKGVSIIFRSSSGSYSEAFAGSGEVAVVMLVRKVLAAPKASLILLDEPEVSLHPLAQQSLIEFLLSQIRINHHQIVLTSHSPTLIEKLPPSAIKVFSRDSSDGRFVVGDQCPPSEAFYRLGATNPHKITLLVEDRLAREILLKALREIGDAAVGAFDVTVCPGGAPAILSQYLPGLVHLNANVHVFLDGDQKLVENFPDPAGMNSNELDGIPASLIGLCGVEVKLPMPGGQGEQQNIQAKRRVYSAFLSFLRERLHYLPFDNPERIVVDTLGLTPADNPKVAIRNGAIKAYQLLDNEAPSGDDIFNYARLSLAHISMDNEQYSALVESIRTLYQKT